MEGSKRETVTTLDGQLVKLTGSRRDGNTTRLVDHAIQILFSGDICVVLDHHEWGMNRMANEHLMNKVLDRLQHEHGHLFARGAVNVNRMKYEIYLNDITP